MVTLNAHGYERKSAFACFIAEEVHGSLYGNRVNIAEEYMHKLKKGADKGNGRKMVNTAIVGCNGKMGCFVAQAVQSREDCNVLFGVDAFGESNYDFDVFKTFDEATETPDVIIDFSNPAALDGMLAYAVDNKVPCVICTTGFSKDQIAKIEDAAKTIPVFYSGNMSLGINLLIELSKEAAKILGNQFDIEIVEKHHNLKLDAPSGTAHRDLQR